MNNKQLMTILTIDEALAYFKLAEKEGYYAPDTEQLSLMTEEEIIGLAEELGARGDHEAEGER